MMKQIHAPTHSLVAVLAATAIALTFVSVPTDVGAVSRGERHSATSKDWKVTVWVSRTSTKAGESIPATVTVDNRTGRGVFITGCPGTDYEIVAGNSSSPNKPVIPAVLCASKMSPGVHVFRTKVLTKYVNCGAKGSPCGQPPKLPPLPYGTYRTQLVLPTSAFPLPMPPPLTITLTGSAAKVSVPNCRVAQVTENVATVPMKPPNNHYAWFGQVVFKNTGPTCELSRSTVSVIAETGAAVSPRALSKKYLPVVLGLPFPVQHGGSAHTWLEVTDTQPKNWKPILCPPTAVSGLEVGGPSQTWPLKYFALTAVGVCSAFIINARSGLLQPGA